MAVGDKLSKCWSPPVVFAVLLLPLGLGVAVLWGIWRLRTLQMQLATGIGENYEGDDWGFGQVMAVTIFVPVLVEIGFEAMRIVRRRGPQGG